MIFAAPWVLLALAALPVAVVAVAVDAAGAAERESFPAIRLLLGLHAREEIAGGRTPWWLLLLRVLAAGLVIVGLAQPVLDAGSHLPGAGPVLLVVDNGWAAASDWPRRMQMANGVLDSAARAGRQAALLATVAADAQTGGAAWRTAVMPVPDLARGDWRRCTPSLGRRFGRRRPPRWRAGRRQVRVARWSMSLTG